MRTYGKSHELLNCPCCGQRQVAEVLHTRVHDVRLHECIKCDYIITESDWIVQKQIPQEKVELYKKCWHGKDKGD